MFAYGGAVDAVTGSLGGGLGGAVVGALALQLIGQAAQHAEAHEGARAHRPIIQPTHAAAQTQCLRYWRPL